MASWPIREANPLRRPAPNSETIVSFCITRRITWPVVSGVAKDIERLGDLHIIAAAAREDTYQLSSFTMPNQDKAAPHRVPGIFCQVAATYHGLTRIADLLDSGQLTSNVDDVLPLAEARPAHELPAGKPRKGGKIAFGGRYVSIARSANLARTAAPRASCLAPPQGGSWLTPL